MDDFDIADSIADDFDIAQDKGEPTLEQAPGPGPKRRRRSSKLLSYCSAALAMAFLVVDGSQSEEAASIETLWARGTSLPPNFTQPLLQLLELLFRVGPTGRETKVRIAFTQRNGKLALPRSNAGATFLVLLTIKWSMCSNSMGRDPSIEMTLTLANLKQMHGNAICEGELGIGSHFMRYQNCMQLIATSRVCRITPTW